MTELQTRVLDIYKVFKKICDDNGLRQYAIGGTAIGAVRNEGFIPWDDDIDVDMPWPDYLEFIKIARKKLPPELDISSGLSADDTFLFTKVFEKNSTFFVDYVADNPSSYTGVYIDIFPLIGLPSNIHNQEKFNTDINDVIHEIYKVRGDGYRNTPRAEELLYEYHKLAGRYNYDKSSKIRRGVDTKINEGVYPRKWFDGSVEISFEDTTVILPIGYDKQLRQHFGNYMELPQENERVSHLDESLLDLNTPYIEYINLIYISQKNKHFIEYLKDATTRYKKIIVSQAEDYRAAERMLIDTQSHLNRELDALGRENKLLKESVLKKDNDLESLRSELASYNSVKYSIKLTLSNLRRYLREKLTR